MSTEAIAARAPGKVFLAGEYSVLEGKQAFLIAIDRYVTAEFYPGEYGSPEGELVASALETAYAYLKDSDVRVRKGSIRILNGLNDQTGRKLGLGSSGAITVAVIKAILKVHKIACDASLLFKLGAISECRIQPQSSFGDIAASSYGGFIEYTPVDLRFLKERMHSSSIKDLVSSDWPGLSVSRYSWPADTYPLLGWTGEPASTESAVEKYQSAKSRKMKDWSRFLEDYQTRVAEPLERCLGHGDSSRFRELIRDSRLIVRQMSEDLGLGLMSTTLDKLVRTAESLGASAKPTGSWLGDCGIALCDSPEQLERLEREWQSIGVRPIRIQIAPEEV